MHDLEAILLYKTMFNKRKYSVLKCAFTEIYSTLQCSLVVVVVYDREFQLKTLQEMVMSCSGLVYVVI